MATNILYNGMDGSMLDPAAYVRRAKVVSESKSQKITEETLERVALERCPNYRHSDGRIYASRPGEPYFAVTVSPLNPNFLSQIEPGILPVVSALLEKGYLPVSSCAGHGVGDSRSFVKIVFGSDDAATDFIKEFGTMDYVTLKKLDTSANIMQYWDDDRPGWRALQEGETVQTSREHEDINRLYKRSYTKVCYVDLNLYDTRGLSNIWSFFKIYKTIKDIRINKARRIKDIADRILSMKEYEL